MELKIAGVNINTVLFVIGMCIVAYTTDFAWKPCLGTFIASIHLTFREY